MKIDNFKFKKFTKKGKRGVLYPFISVRKGGIYLNKEARNLVKKWEKVGIFIDKNNHSIKLVQDSNGYKVTINPHEGGMIGATGVFKIMPVGRYKYLTETIFIK